MSWICRSCPFLKVEEATPWSKKKTYCTNFPRKRKEVKFSIYRRNSDPKWCPKIKADNKTRKCESCRWFVQKGGYFDCNREGGCQFEHAEP